MPARSLGLLWGIGVRGRALSACQGKLKIKPPREAPVPKGLTGPVSLGTAASLGHRRRTGHLGSLPALPVPGINGLGCKRRLTKDP
jgi:hypothetical protein